MKKRLCSMLLTAAVSVSLLAGCGAAQAAESSTPAAEPASSETAQTESEAPAQTTTEQETETTGEAEGEEASILGAMEGVTLIIGTSGTYAPFSYFAEDGMTLQGFDVDMLRALQEVLGFEISNDTIQDMDYGPLGTSLGQGQLDLGAAALCATDERKKSMNFSDVYYDAGIVVVVAEDEENIASVEDLTSGEYTVAVQTGTIAYEYAVANLPEECLQAYDSQALAYKAVEDGIADATIYDQPGTAYSISTGEIHLKIVGDEFYNGQAPYAIAFSFAICEQYPDIIDNFNAAIAYLQENGTLDEIKATWCE